MIGSLTLWFVGFSMGFFAFAAYDVYVHKYGWHDSEGKR